MSGISKALQVHPNDNVAVAISTLKKNSNITVEDTTIDLLSEIPAGHKFALTDIKQGSDIIKYGFRIGKAKADIAKGEWGT